LASGAVNTAELEPFLTDPNQAIRVVATMNTDADAEILDRFANDKYWGAVRIEVVNHPYVSDVTLVRLLEAKVSKCSVIHHAAYKKLMKRCVKIDKDMKLNVNKENKILICIIYLIYVMSEI
jgi:hypothetical protein